MKFAIIGIILSLLLFTSFSVVIQNKLLNKLKDTVPCNVVKNSNQAYPKNCTSTYDNLRPIDVTSTFTFIGSSGTMWYGSQDWEYWLQDRNGSRTQIQNSKDCYVNEPRPVSLNPGTDLYIGVKCFSVPRKIQSGDRIVLNVFSSKQHGVVTNLQYYIPLNGFKAEQFNNKFQNNIISLMQKYF